MSDTDNKTLEMAEDLTAANIASQTAKARVKQSELPQFKGWDGETCFDCGCDLPEERIEMFRVRCVPCQTIAERKEKGLF